MPLDPRAKRFLDVLAATNPVSVAAQTVEERRVGLAQLMAFSGPLEAVGGIQACNLRSPGGPELRARVYTPAGAAAGALPGLVYFHGGGLVAGSLDTHDAIGRALANAGACRVVAVDYRLAPEHRFPAAVEDALAAIDGIRTRSAEFGIDGAQLAIAGDSAGATLAAVAARELTRGQAGTIAFQLLLCPILDYGGQSASRREFAAGYLVDEATLNHDLLYYLPPDTDRHEPRVSPLREPDLHGLPYTLIHTAECDPLRDEGFAYANRLTDAGVAVGYTCHAGMIHLFYGMAAVIPYARTAFAQIGAEVRDAFGRHNRN